MAFSSMTPAHAATTSEGIIIPLYTYPGSTWDTVTNVKLAHPSVPIIAIVNPSNGPGSSKDANYASGIAKLRSAGVQVIGYVSTGYTSRPLSTVEADINSWSSWYPGLNGIFFDEQSNTAGGESYYSQASSYAHSKGLAFTVGNPGANTIPTYLSTVNLVLIYESPGVPNLGGYSSWTGYDKSKLGMIPFGVGSFPSSWTQNAEQVVGWIYVTNDNLPNPWDSVTPYLGNLASMFDTGSSAPSSVASDPLLTVTSLDQTGNAVTGMWTTISQNGNTISTGYTPMTVSLSSGTYSVTASDYGQMIFSHWQDGSTSRTKTINLAVNTALTAYYNNGQVSTKHSLTVSSLDQNGNAVTGMWTTISQNGNTISTGYTPMTVSVSSGTYSVTAADYDQMIFSHWQDGSTSRTKTINLAVNTALTAYYNNGQSTTSTMTVTTADQNGNPINGYYTTLYDSSGNAIQSQYSPASFTVASGKQYKVSVADYGSYAFSHWQDGTTNRVINVVGGNVALKATYHTSSVNLNIKSIGVNGNAVTGMWTTVSDSSGQARTGYTPTTFTATSGAPYTVTVADYQNYVFAHWDNGSTDRTRTVNPTADTTLTAYYNVQ